MQKMHEYFTYHLRPTLMSFLCTFNCTVIEIILHPEYPGDREAGGIIDSEMNKK